VSGLEHATKTKAARLVNLLRPLADDLAAYRRALASARPSTLLFPRPDGRPWSTDDYRNWRRRRFRPAAESAGLRQLRPYDLRHFFVSLLVNAGTPILDVAAQTGHSPEECIRSYCHRFELHGPGGRGPQLSRDAFRSGWRRTEAAVQAERTSPGSRSSR
jgi:integrase